MTLLGREKCQSMIDKLTDGAKQAALALPQGEELAKIADMLCKRSN